MERRITVHLDNDPVYDILLSDSFSGLSEEVGKLPVQGRRACIVTDTNVEPLYREQVETELTGCFSEVVAFSGLSEEVGKLPVQGRRACIVTDTNVEPLYREQVETELTGCFSEVVVFTFPAGEEQKNLDSVRRLYEKLIDCHFDRKDWLVALGGGVVGDLSGFAAATYLRGISFIQIPTTLLSQVDSSIGGKTGVDLEAYKNVVGDLSGFAAATYLRGISFIQIPTTLLSQVDSSIGGKTGVDLEAYKNMVGAFHMPKLVYTNVQTLTSLPDEQYSSGMGEILKHGLIKDASYFSWLSDHAEAIANRELSVCMEMIRISDEIKRQVVENDPKEHGERALLNFGHTLGHALEKQMNFSVLHGHCVGLGCLAAARISANRGYIEEAAVAGIRRVMKLFRMPSVLKDFDLDAVIEDTKNDKKMDGDRIRFILLKNIGEAYIDTTVTEEEMKAGLTEIQKEF